MGVERHRFAIAIVCFLPVAAAAAVGMRMLSRWRRGVKYGWDDWLLVIASLLSFGLIAPSVMNIRRYHIGYHAWEVPLTTAELTNQNFDQYYAILLSFNLLSIPILPLAKASIIVILLRVGKVIQPLRRALYIVFIFNAGACIVPWAVFIFICPPLEGDAWGTHTFGNLQCLSRDQQGQLLLFVNCANLVTDIAVFPVPFFIMRELLSTSLRSKMIFLLTFASSLCVTALSAVKIYVTFRDRILLVDNSDWMWSLEFCITHGEGNMGIIVACLPTLRGLFSPGIKPRQGTNPTGTYASLNLSTNCTSVAGGRVDSTSSGIYRTWSRGSKSDKDEQLPRPSSDILMTTVVKASSSLVDDDVEQNFHQGFPEPRHQNTEKLGSGKRKNSTGNAEPMGESNRPRHTYRLTPLLPPTPAPAHLRHL